MSEVERLRPPMACHHGPDGAEDCEALCREVCEALGVDRDLLITAVVQDLYWEHDVHITGIPTDMWSAVQSEWGDGTVADMFAECDRVEDGFALTWKTWKEWFEKREAAGNE